MCYPENVYFNWGTQNYLEDSGILHPSNWIGIFLTVPDGLIQEYRQWRTQHFFSSIFFLDLWKKIKSCYLVCGIDLLYLFFKFHQVPINHATFKRGLIINSHHFRFSPSKLNFNVYIMVYFCIVIYIIIDLKSIKVLFTKKREL